MAERIFPTRYFTVQTALCGVVLGQLILRPTRGLSDFQQSVAAAHRANFQWIVSLAAIVRSETAIASGCAAVISDKRNRRIRDC
jgi:hypothetical protein